jgi:putative membrane protein
LRAWAGLVALVLVAINSIGDSTGWFLAFWRELNRPDQFVWLGLGVLVLLLIVLLCAWLSWRHAHFRVDATTLQLAKGIIFRQRRHLPLDRVQAVDVIHPLIGRLFGLVKLKVESAGGAGSAIELAYLRQADAARWRRAILSRALQARQGGPGTADGVGLTASLGAGQFTLKSEETQVGEMLGDADLEAPELFAVPTGRVLGSIMLSVGMWGVPLLIAGIVAAVLPNSPVALGALLPWLLGAVASLWSRLTTDFAFTAKQTSRGLTLSHGLTTRVSQTIPPGRILAVQLTQSLPWRGFHWWRAQMNVAGYDSGQSGDGQLLVPVADAETIRRAIWAVAPSLAQDGVWRLIESALTTSGPTPGFSRAPRQACLFDPLTWRRTAYSVTANALILRSGLLIRRVQVVPHARIQAIELSQGPWERRLELANVRFHSARGPISPAIYHLAADDAAQLARGQSQLLLAAMAATQESTSEPSAHLGTILTEPEVSEPTA